MYICVYVRTCNSCSAETTTKTLWGVLGGAQGGGV